MAAAILAGIAAPATHADDLSPVVEHLESNTTLELGATATSDANAAGLSFNRIIPLSLSMRTILLVEVSAAKGDEEFGMVSGGMAIRHLLVDSQTYAGLNFFYDGLQDTNGYSYSQLGFGAEISRGRFTLRGNYYLPIGNDEETQTSSRNVNDRSDVTTIDAKGRPTTVSTSRTFTETFQVTQDAAQGWDVELAVALFEQRHTIDPVVAVGYYSVSDGRSTYSGLKARGEVTIAERATIGVEWRQDAGDIGQEWRAGVRFAIPLGKAPATSQPREEVLAGNGDGKTTVPPGGRDGKTFAGGDSKTVRPPASTGVSAPRGFFDPVQRTAWPNVFSYNDTRVSGVRRDTSISVPATSAIGPIPKDDCGCKSGPILVFP